MIFLRFIRCGILVSIIVSLTPAITLGQIVIVPATNANDSSDNRPWGCYWGYERTQMLFTQAELGNTNYISHIAFYVNAVSNPASETPVVIRMKSSNASALSSAKYDAASTGSTLVWSGKIKASSLVAGAWAEVALNTPFYVGNNGLEIFIETNFGAYGGEGLTAKQFRQSHAGSLRCQFWYNDLTPPKDNGIVRFMRPNVRLTFVDGCTGTPAPGTTLVTMNPVCKDSLFTLSLSGTTTGGLLFQWQSSSDGSNYTNISGATSASWTTTQTTATYYRCQVTCSLSGFSATSSAVQVTMKAHYNCYCASGAFSTQDSKIDSVRLGAMVAGSSPTACESYTDNTTLPAPTITPGTPTKLKVRNGSCTGQIYDVYLNVYIDYNQNSDFGSGNELVFSGGPYSSLNGIPEITFFPPTSAKAGLTRMRLVLSENDPPSFCGGYSRGETEDYLVNVAALTACATTSWSAGNTVATPSKACVGKPVVLSLDNYPAVSGLSYQWQSSPDNISWTNITGATGFTYTINSFAAPMYYRCRLTCSGGSIQNSTSVFLEANQFYNCYCSSFATDPLDTQIDTILINGMSFSNNPNVCQTYTKHTATVDITTNVNNTLRIVNGSCSGEYYPSYLAVYIDYNKDGDFYDANELVWSHGPVVAAGQIPEFTFMPPGGTSPGLTGMRVVLHEGESVPDACAVSTYGETEDFLINLIQLPPCIDPPVAGITVVTPNTACSNDLPVTVQLSLAGNSSGVGQTYQWEWLPDGASSWLVLNGATNPYFATSVSGTTFFRCQISCGTSTLASVPAAFAATAEPAGNQLGTALQVPALPYVHSGNNFASLCWTDTYAGPENQTSPDVFYKVSVDSPGKLFVSTCSTTDLPTYLHLLDGTGQHIRSNGGFGPLCASIYASDTIHHASDSVVYFVVVEGQDQAEGDYKLEIWFEPEIGSHIAEKNVVGDLSVFPNPADDHFYLIMHGASLPVGHTELTLYHPLGMTVLRKAITQEELHGRWWLPATLDTGIYVVELCADKSCLRTLLMVY